MNSGNFFEKEFMLLFCLLPTPKLQTQTVTDLCSYYFQIAGLNNMSLKMSWLLESMKVIMQFCCRWGHVLFVVTIAVVSSGWFLNIVQASGLTKRRDMMAKALSTQFSSVPTGIVWVRAIALLGEHMCVKECFADKMTFPFPLSQNQI